jgi:hypothetical protein
MNAASLKPMVQHFWRGGYALGLAFWVFGVLGSLLLLAAVYATLDASGTPSTPVALAIGLGGLAYQVWVVVGVWRSAASYPGPRAYALAARGVVAVYAAYGVVMLLQVALMLGLTALVFLNPPFIK